MTSLEGALNTFKITRYQISFPNSSAKMKVTNTTHLGLVSSTGFGNKIAVFAAVCYS